MSLTPKTDVKNHLFARGRARNHPHIVPSQPNETRVPEAVPGEAKVDPSPFDNDFVGEHSPNGISIVPAYPVTGSVGANASDVTGNLHG
jgi:hypothetical protein